MSARAAKSTSRASATKKEETMASVKVPKTTKQVVEAEATTQVAKKTRPATAPVKSPRSKSPKTAAKDAAPVKSPRSKSPKPVVAPKPAAVVPAVAPVAAPVKKATPSTKKQNKRSKGKVTRGTRTHNTRVAPIDDVGIGIGPAKTKNMILVILNPEESEVRRALIKAENKPIRPKPDEKNPNPPLPPQGPQVNVDDLPEEILSVIKRARDIHRYHLMNEYARDYINKMDSKRRDSYNAKKAADVEFNEAKKAAEKDEIQKGVVEEQFNRSFDKHFYDGFAAFAAKDNYRIGGSRGNPNKNNTGTPNPVYNQWSLAATLVNKGCTRLSGGVQDRLAAFLDLFVMQYAHNGLLNCLAGKPSNLHVWHALTPSAEFDTIVPLDAFARTLDHYKAAKEWINELKQVKEHNNQLRSQIKSNQLDATTEFQPNPKYPTPKYPTMVTTLGVDTEDAEAAADDEATADAAADDDEVKHDRTNTINFENYIADICRSVRSNMAAKFTSEGNVVDAARVSSTKISVSFKVFCSAIVYETIVRVSKLLKETVELKSVKTINDDLMCYVLRQLCNSCGIDHKPLFENVDVRLNKYHLKCDERRKKRQDSKDQNAKENKDADAKENVDDDVVSDDNNDNLDIAYEE